MLDSIRFLLDLSIVVAAALSGIFWYQASRQSLRRIEKEEALDRLDVNRMIVAFNRTQALNRRGALATSVAGALAAIRMLAGLL